MSGLTINDRNTWDDFGALLNSRDISPPEIQNITEEIPFVDGEIDFTYMDGKVHYKPRSLVYIFEFVEYPKTKLRNKVTAFENWIFSLGVCNIYDEDVDGWYYIARPISCKESESGFTCKVTVTFTAAPKRRKIGTIIMTVAEFTPAANTSEYVWFYAGDRLYYNSIGSTDIFDIKNISADKKIITATINVTNWDKGVAKIQVPSFIEQVLARIDGNILTPSITLDSQYYYIVGSGHHVLSLTFTAYSQVSISDVMAQYVTAVGFSTGFIANTPPNPNNMMISSVDSLPQVNINGVVADTNNIELSDDITVMEISGAKNDRLKLIYDDVEYML